MANNSKYGPMIQKAMPQIRTGPSPFRNMTGKGGVGEQMKNFKQNQRRKAKGLPPLTVDG